MKNKKIDANEIEIRVICDDENEYAYIFLADIVKYRNLGNVLIVVLNWVYNHSTISFLVYYS